MKGKRIKDSKDYMLFSIIGYITVVFFVLMCVLPIWLIVAGSLSDNAAIMRSGYSLWFRQFSTEAYELVFKVPSEMINAYKVSIGVTICGTLINLIICSSAGYVLSRRDFRWRNTFSFYFFFTTIFSAGLVPYYIMCVNTLGFKNNPYIAMVLCGAFNYFYVIIFRSFMSEIPVSLGESAKIDGANDLRIFTQIILPLSKPVMATVGLFAALYYWGDWYHAMLFCTDSRQYPLQYYLYCVINRAKAMSELASLGAEVETEVLPTETYKLAITVVTTGPIIMVYPFVQKFFIKGMTVGAVKG